MRSEIFGSCDTPELLWQSWVDTRCALRLAKGTLLPFFRSEEEAARKALNNHMAKHECGRPVGATEIAVVAKAS
jgi:hypothetical protein